MLAAVGLLAATAALAGCSSGKVSQTADQQEAIDGVNMTVGTLAIRDAAVDFPAGDATSYPAAGAAPLTLVLVNSSGTEETLLSATSPYAKSITLAPADPDATPPAIGCISAASALQSASPSTPASHHPSGRPSSSASARPSGSASASASGSAEPSASAAAGPAVSNFAVPSSSVVQLVRGCPHLVLSGLTQPFPNSDDPKNPLTLIPVTLTFRSAGPVTLKLPLASPATPLPRTPVSGFAPGEGE
jgi:copper(I)-binding protein